MRVRRNEGVAIHIGPEPCAVIREGVGEASAGERIGQPLSRESDLAQGAVGEFVGRPRKFVVDNYPVSILGWHRPEIAMDRLRQDRPVERRAELPVWGHSMTGQ